jgi:outer membrane receptor protein involved in Fe transport
MKRLLTITVFIICQSAGLAQSSIKGNVVDTLGNSIPYTSVSLLHPADSTLAYFSITNDAGMYEMKDIANGNYILQAAFMGFKTYYKSVTFPRNDNSPMAIVLKQQTAILNEVNVVAEMVPVSIKKDTVEYNAGSFKTKPDANVEQLLKKLPGVDVDRNGNIKAHGENVNKVLVDGKEFFGDDPKVATKNLPADAIKKVQVFDGKSDAAQFTGIDDGFRQKTINLQLKDGKKSGYFGDVEAGGGTEDRYKLNAKVYRFTKTSQLAALGMLNNLNEFGFSLEDYINFSGGIRNLLSGGAQNLQFNLNDNLPVNFGQPNTGLTTSGAIGLNYSFDYGTNKKFGISYMGNGANKNLNQQSFTKNFTSTGDFTRNSDDRNNTENYANRIYVNWKDGVDTQRVITFNGNASLNNNHELSSGLTESSYQQQLANKLSNTSTTKANTFSSKAGLTYIKRLKGKWHNANISLNGNYSTSLTNADWKNYITLYSQNLSINDIQFQDIKKTQGDVQLSTSATRKLGNGFFLEPELTVGTNVDIINRQQKVNTPSNEVKKIDSLSRDFIRVYSHVRPQLQLTKNNNKIQYGISLSYEHGLLTPDRVLRPGATSTYGYLLPSFNWQNAYSMGKRLSFNYTSTVSAPTAAQLFPTPDVSNPLNRFVGNPALKPQYNHNANFGWIWFDQFSFTSIFSSIGARYTKDKISTQRTIFADLSELRTLVNVENEYSVNARGDFNKPIKKLGITFNASIKEEYTSGYNIINTNRNQTTTLSHNLELGIGNRKKDKWDIEIGVSGNITDARYSIDNAYNNVFFNTGAFSEISYQPTDHWHFNVTADVTQYNARSFQESVIIPLLKADVSYYFLKGNRGVLTLTGFDLLDKNKSINRISQLNYLTEIRSNIISRYFMLSFKYRLNKLGKGSNMIETRVRNR